jgi:rhodanese-related sulfurtransferase
MNHLSYTALRTLAGAALVLLIAASPLLAETYKKKVDHKGRDVTPKEAYKLLRQDPKHTFIIDTRTQYEYQDVGHPEGAYNIPYEFYTDELKKIGDGLYEYKWKQNANYCADLREIFNPATDILVIICRSGGRSIKAVNSAVDCGFSPEKTYDLLLGGFEGDVVEDQTNSSANGWSAAGGSRTFPGPTR